MLEPETPESGILFPTPRRVASATASEPSKRLQFLEPIKANTRAQLRHSSVDPAEDGGDEDEWMMIDQDSFRSALGRP